MKWGGDSEADNFGFDGGLDRSGHGAASGFEFELSAFRRKSCTAKAGKIPGRIPAGYLPSDLPGHGFH